MTQPRMRQKFSHGSNKHPGILRDPDVWEGKRQEGVGGAQDSNEGRWEECVCQISSVPQRFCSYTFLLACPQCWPLKTPLITPRAKTDRHFKCEGDGFNRPSLSWKQGLQNVHRTLQYVSVFARWPDYRARKGFGRSLNSVRNWAWPSFISDGDISKLKHEDQFFFLLSWNETPSETHCCLSSNWPLHSDLGLSRWS